MQAAVDLATTYLASTGADESSSLLFDDEFHQAIGGVSNISVVQLLTMFQKVRPQLYLFVSLDLNLITLVHCVSSTR